VLFQVVFEEVVYVFSPVIAVLFQRILQDQSRKDFDVEGQVDALSLLLLLQAFYLQVESSVSGCSF